MPKLVCPDLVGGPGSNVPVQAFVAVPSKVQVPMAIATVKTLKVGAGGDIDITGWFAANIVPSVNNLTGYFNNDSTKTWTIWAGQANVIFIHPEVTQITISGVDTRVEIGGM